MFTERNRCGINQIFRPTSRVQGSDLAITWITEVGRTYRVQFNDDLNAPGWTDLTDVLAAGPLASHSNPSRHSTAAILSNPSAESLSHQCVIKDDGADVRQPLRASCPRSHCG